jgi:hypothetical protein
MEQNKRIQLTWDDYIVFYNSADCRNEFENHTFSIERPNNKNQTECFEAKLKAVNYIPRRPEYKESFNPEKYDVFILIFSRQTDHEEISIVKRSKYLEGEIGEEHDEYEDKNTNIFLETIQ